MLLIPKPLTYPARPTNGGRYDLASAKLGQWSFEPKYNGWRALIHTPSGTLFNRYGQALSIASEFKLALEALKGCRFEWLDGEALERRHNIGRGSLIIFDAPGLPGDYVARRSVLLRAFALPPFSVLAPASKPGNDSAYLTPSFPAEKAAWLWAFLQDQNKLWGCQFFEGFVAKKETSLYPVQLRNPEQKTASMIKHRFVK